MSQRITMPSWEPSKRLCKYDYCSKSLWNFLPSGSDCRCHDYKSQKW